MNAHLKIFTIITQCRFIKQTPSLFAIPNAKKQHELYFKYHKPYGCLNKQIKS